MATIEKRGNSYRIVFRYGNQKFSRSLATKVKRVAEAALVRLEDNLRRAKLGTLVIPDSADVADFLLSDGQVVANQQQQATSSEPKPTVRTLAKLCDEFRHGLPENSLEPSTLECLEIHIRHFKRIFRGTLLLKEMNLATLQTYVTKRSKAKGRHGKPLSADTIKKELSSLTTIWTWGQEHGYVHKPLSKRGLRFPKTEEKPPFATIEEIHRKIAIGGLSKTEIEELWDAVYLTLDEIEELLLHVRRNARHGFIHPMLATAAYTEARRSELIRSQLHDISGDVTSFCIREKKRVRGRNSTRTVPISNSLQGILQEWLADHPGSKYSFPIEPDMCRSSKDRDEPTQLTPNEARHHFRSALRGTRFSKLRGWHVFRHSFISNCAVAGVDQRLIDEWVGPPGVGKSHLAQAIGLALVKAGYTILYRSIFDAVRDLLHDEAFDGHDRIMNKYLKPDLLILDDMGIKQLPKRSGEYLFEIIMRRHELKSTMMTSNRPLEDWGKLIGDVPAATAILDRLLQDAEVIQITGKSYRIGRRSSNAKSTNK